MRIRNTTRYERGFWKSLLIHLLGIISVRDCALFRKPLHALLVDENLQISLNAIEAILKVKLFVN
jgi:hypothetical protein